MDTQHLKRLIAENKVEDVLEILLEQVQGQNDDFAKQIISISNRYHRYSDDILKGIENKEISKITSDLLEVVTKIEKRQAKPINRKEDSPSDAREEEQIKESQKEQGFFEKIPLYLAILAVLGISFGIGLYNGYSSRKLSDDEFYKRFIFSKIKLIKDKETQQFFLVYNCDNKDFYHFNVDANQVLDENFMLGSGKSTASTDIQINFQELIGLTATSSLILYDNFFAYAARPFRTGGNIKAKIIFTLGLISTYGIGKWIGSRKIPACNCKEITEKLEDVEFWKKYERYTYNFVNNLTVFGSGNFPINSIANCPIFLMVDSTKVLQKEELSKIVQMEEQYIQDRQNIRTTKYDISSKEIGLFLERNSYLMKEFMEGKHLTETGVAWKFHNYTIFDYSQKISDYNYLFEEFIQKMK